MLIEKKYINQRVTKLIPITLHIANPAPTGTGKEWLDLSLGLSRIIFFRRMFRRSPQQKYEANKAKIEKIKSSKNIIFIENLRNL